MRAMWTNKTAGCQSGRFFRWGGGVVRSNVVPFQCDCDAALGRIDVLRENATETETFFHFFLFRQTKGRAALAALAEREKQKRIATHIAFLSLSPQLPLGHSDRVRSIPTFEGKRPHLLGDRRSRTGSSIDISIGARPPRLGVGSMRHDRKEERKTRFALRYRKRKTQTHDGRQVAGVRHQKPTLWPTMRMYPRTPTCLWVTDIHCLAPTRAHRGDHSRLPSGGCLVPMDTRSRAPT